MRAVFLDTAGLIANWDSTAQYHAAARRVYAELLAQPMQESWITSLS